MSTISDQTRVKKIVAKSGSSFYWGMNILKEPQRRAMFSVYAFCRIVDDIADSKKTKNKKIHELNNWEKKIKLIYQNKTSDFITRELDHSINNYDLLEYDFISIINGMKMDVIEKIKYPPQKKIELYCDRVAGAVGCLSMNIFEINNEFARQYAINLGRAFQLTNILRDLKEDCHRDRCYIPYEIVSKFKLQDYTPKELLKSKKILKVCDELKKTTEYYYQKSNELSKKFSREKLKAPLLMKAMYLSIFKKICHKNWNVEKKVRLNIFEKIIIILNQMI